MIVFLGSAAVVVVAVATLAIGSWWLLTVLVLGGATAFIVAYAQRITSQGDKPDPRTEARLDEERPSRPRSSPAGGDED